MVISVPQQKITKLLQRIKQAQQPQITRFMQVGCKSIGQDDGHDSGNQESVTPHSLLTKRPSQGPEKQSTQLGKEPPLVLYEHERTPMVEGVEDDLVCLTAPCRKMPRLDHLDFQQQLYRHQICHESRRGGFIDFTPRISNPNPRLLQQTQDTSVVQAYTWSNKCNSRQTQQENDPTVQGSITNRIFQAIQWKWGPLTIDAFATRVNKKLNIFWSLHLDPEASALDAFSQQWPTTVLYLNLPWKLITRVLQQMKLQKIKRAVLVIPYWPTKYWYQMLMKMKQLQKPMFFQMKK